MNLTEEERDLLLAALFELRHDDILALVDKLGGERDTALFGAYRDEWAELDAPVPDYPADETDEG